MATNEVRIIGGKWKGRKLPFSAVDGVRPTTGRVRGSVFNWLAGELAGARCLDLFAGSGALAFEALSRGAEAAVLVERDRNVAAALRRNARRIGANARIVAISAQRFLRSAHESWDLIFIDPPYGSPVLQETLGLIAERQLLAPSGRIYFERRRDEALPFPTPGQAAPPQGYWELLKYGQAGDSQFGLLASALPD